MDTALGGGPLTQLSSLVGRTDELVELARLLDGVRLLTLTGPAGVGKSRLALELIGQELRRKRRDVSVVRLGTCTEPDEIRRQVLAALGEPPGATPPSVATTSEGPDGPESTGRDQLLLLDDCEHVLDSCGELLTELLPGRPRLRVLATSRESLQLPGETVFPVAGLALPDTGPETGSDAGSDTVLNTCLRSDAVTLFVDRARAVVPGFQLTHDNAVHVGEICARLDGLPLPIEMAARLIRIFPPSEIVTRLDDRLALLTNGWRLADDRHQSLRASLEWSYALLNPQEQALLRRLSVLPGDFGPDTAAAVASDLPDPAAIPRLLIGLEAKSVITALTDTGGPTRFRLLESMRCLGHDRLIAEGEETGAYERLVSWLTAMCLPLHGEAVVPPTTLERLAKERTNLTHALHHLHAGTDERQLLLASALAAIETADGRATGTADLVAQALDRTAPDSDYRPVALAAAASLAARDADHHSAFRHIDEAVELEHGRDHPQLLARLLLLRGTIQHLRDERTASLADLQEALAIGARLRHDALSALCLSMTAQHQVETGELGAAERELADVIPIMRRHAPRHWLHRVLMTAGALALEKDDLAAAERCFTEAMRSHAEHRRDVARSLEGMALVATRAYRFDRGLRLLGAAKRMRARAPRDASWWTARTAEARETAFRALPTARAKASLAAGGAMPRSQVLALAFDPGSTDAPREERSGHPLSKREWDVAALVVEGLTNRQIAARVHVSVRTVETHIRHIRNTLGLRSRAHLAAWAAQLRNDAPTAHRGAPPRPTTGSPPTSWCSTG
ncbi:ATP-binding protein [Streptomyces sp. GMR22]|uniref:ATP-binding protein n=1 Tax=Streptomyces sp. GMR22 TaxID=2759524 RepID=UPI0015FBD3A1|nr:LuxR C-terminal-related transcriptional regulator [Streptomyces sp. GMR22]MBA6441271.1 AAA family ATPase [Streptomyces sp. GMR22]